MSENLLNEITQALSKTQHPSINASLPALGMIKDVKIEEKVVNLIFNLPFAGIPESIKNILLGNIKKALNPFGLKYNIELAIMDEIEKQHFLEVEKANWKG